MKAIFLITLVVLIYTSSAELVATMDSFPGVTNEVAGTITLTYVSDYDTTTTLTLALTGLPTFCEWSEDHLCAIAIYSGTSCDDIGVHYYNDDD